MSASLTDLPLAVSIGDPAGIGPEIILEAWRKLANEPAQPQRGFFVVGGANVLQAAADARGIDCPIVMISSPVEATSSFASGVPVLDHTDATYSPGSPNPAGARLALESLSKATALAIDGAAAGVVTAPVGKAELMAIGFDFPGQTEFLSHACGLAADDAVMMLAGPSLRTVPLTVHVALRDVASLLTSEMIVHKARITAAALKRDFGLPAPRIAIAGLNPHAGERGQFGDEEDRIIGPAIEELAAQGIDIIGPVPGDALFTPRVRQTYDAALCMYHDQALIPIKALEFDEGVNVTLGLPIIRTSPDHGTAFDIAGQDKADASAMISAIALAGRCADARAQALAADHG